MSKNFTAVFETSRLEWYKKDKMARVWLWGAKEIGKDNFVFNNSIESFFDFVKGRENYKIYFHNLKFYGEFIISYLLKNNFEYIKSKDERKDNSFLCLVSAIGEFYKIEIYFKVKGSHVNKVEILDSYKLIDKTTKEIDDNFKYNLKKEIDKNRYREVGYIPNEEEIEYLKSECEILSKTLESLFKENINSITIGSNALKFYKKSVSNFNKYFPIIPYEIGEDIRFSYRGGFNILMNEYQEKVINYNIITLDLNSLYPFIMSEYQMPIGAPVKFEGKYENDNLYPLYIQKINCAFELKEGKLPTIALRDNPSFKYNELLKSSDGEFVDLFLTKPDLELFLENYNVFFLDYHGGYKFKAVKGIFSNYIEYWTETKIKAKQEDNKVLYLLSKKMLNALYGKMGTDQNIRNKYPVLDPTNNEVYYLFTEKEKIDGVYLPVATFITSYGREKIIKFCQLMKDKTIEIFGENRFIYADTDSCHLKITFEEFEKIKKYIELDDFEIGKWKIETVAEKSIYIKPKCYLKEVIEDNNKVLKTTVSGMPKELAKYINFDNFKRGLSINAETVAEFIQNNYIHVDGGVILKSTSFTIK